MGLTEFLFGSKTKVAFGSTPAQLGVGFVQLDCSVNEIHTDSAEITEHPVEDGSTMTDHIRKLPTRLEIEGIVTNTPITYLASINSPPSTFASDAFVPSFPGSDRADDAYAVMQEMMTQGVTMSVLTSLRSYTSMAIESLVVTRNADTGQVLNCSISMKEVKKAKALSIDVPIPENPANNAASNQGTVPSEAATPAQSSAGSSILSDIASFFGG